MIRKYAGPGEMVPRWYGAAWYDFALDRTVCYPLGVNILARWLFRAWVVLRGRPYHDREIAVAAERLTAERMVTVAEAAFIRGMAEGRRQLIKEFEAEMNRSRRSG